MINKLLGKTMIVAGLLVGLMLSGLVTPVLAKKDRAKVEAKGFLGVYAERMSSDDKEELSADFGVMITKVIKGEAADKAGLKRYDVVQYLDGEKIRRPEDLTEEVRAHKPDSKIVVKLIRDGKQKEIDVILGKQKRQTHAYWFSDKDGKGDFTIKRFRRAYLGVNLMSLDKDLAPYFGVKEDEGVLVTKVGEESPAEKAGLKSGDVLLKVDKENVNSSKDVIDALSDFEEGDKVNLVVMRHKKKITVKAELAERKAFGDIHIFRAPDTEFFYKGGDGHFSIPEIHLDKFHSNDGENRIRIYRDKKLKTLKEELKKNEKHKKNKKKIRELIEHKEHATI